MNLNRSVLAMAMVVGALGGTGCKHKSSAPEDSSTTAADTPPPPDPTPAPTATDTVAPTGTDTAVSMTTPLPPPPADRVEAEGTPPSPKHIWVHGFWHWGGREYAWQPGYWEDPNFAAPSAPPPVRVEVAGVAPGAGYFFAPGYWRWGGTQYLWAPGHWSLRREGYAYAHPYWELVGGRYMRRCRQIFAVTGARLRCGGCWGGCRGIWLGWSRGLMRGRWWRSI